MQPTRNLNNNFDNKYNNNSLIDNYKSSINNNYNSSNHNKKEREKKFTLSYAAVIAREIGVITKPPLFILSHAQQRKIAVTELKKEKKKTNRPQFSLPIFFFFFFSFFFFFPTTIH